MGARLETANGMADGIKWVTAAAVIVVALGGFYMYSEHSLLLRVVGVLVAVGIAGFIALQTEKGRMAWGFVREARTEVRKVVWPTRKETVQTTGVVMAMVALVAVILWMLDGLLAYLVKLVLWQGV